MHVPWGWIKQRPHFIAEGLSDKYDVIVLNKYSFKTSEVRNETSLSMKELIRLPFERFRLIRIINSLLYKLQLKSLVREVDYVWLMSPLQIFDIPFCLHSKLIYDCMDDMLEFDVPESIKKSMQEGERKIFSIAYIFYDYRNG